MYFLRDKRNIRETRMRYFQKCTRTEEKEKSTLKGKNLLMEQKSSEEENLKCNLKSINSHVRQFLLLKI